MESDEIRAEVERRKKCAEDLKIRETLWSLHRHFSLYRIWLREDPEWIFPEIRETVEFGDNQVQFSLGLIRFQIVYKEQPVSEGEITSPGTFRPDDTIRATLALKVNDQKVFEFELCRRTEYRRNGPVFDDHLGEITRFIEGPWIIELADLLQKIEANRESVRGTRDAPRKARELEDLKKRFGI